jgi:hypothetical protein
MNIYNVLLKNNKPADPRLLLGKYAVRVSAEIKACLRVSTGLIVLSGSVYSGSTVDHNTATSFLVLTIHENLPIPFKLISLCSDTM